MQYRMTTWVKGFEGMYLITPQGKIYNVKRKRYLAEAPNTTRTTTYYEVNLGGQSRLIHRLVAEHFISNPEGYECVHHKDHNPRNNNVNNLEWIPRKEHSKLHKVGKIIIQLTLSGEEIGRYESAEEAGRQTQSRANHIRECCLGKRKTHNKFKWKYA